MVAADESLLGFYFRDSRSDGHTPSPGGTFDVKSLPPLKQMARERNIKSFSIQKYKLSLVDIRIYDTSPNSFNDAGVTIAEKCLKFENREAHVITVAVTQQSRVGTTLAAISDRNLIVAPRS